MTTTSVALAQRGQITIPKALRDQYGLSEGSPMTILDLGGVFVLSPRQLSVDASADALREGLIASGATLEGMLADLRQRREADAAE